MPTSNQSPPSLSTLRLIVTAIILGSCVLGGTVIFSASRMGGKVLAEPWPGPVLATLALLDLFVVFAIIPWKYPKPSRLLPEAWLLKRFGLLLLIRVSLLELVLMLCFAFYLLTQDEIVLGTGMVLTMAIICLRPSDETYRQWREALP